MSKWAIIAALALFGCGQKPAETCPAIDQLAARNPVADAKGALVRGDHRLLMLGGLVGKVPGVPDAVAATASNAVMVEGTSDTTTAACHRVRKIAELYASKYNQTILKAGD